MISSLYGPQNRRGSVDETTRKFVYFVLCGREQRRPVAWVRATRNTSTSAVCDCRNFFSGAERSIDAS